MNRIKFGVIVFIVAALCGSVSVAGEPGDVPNLPSAPETNISGPGASVEAPIDVDVDPKISVHSESAVVDVPVPVQVQPRVSVSSNSVRTEVPVNVRVRPQVSVSVAPSVQSYATVQRVYERPVEIRRVYERPVEVREVIREVPVVQNIAVEEAPNAWDKLGEGAYQSLTFLKPMVFFYDDNSNPNAKIDADSTFGVISDSIANVTIRGVPNSVSRLGSGLYNIATFPLPNYDAELDID